MPGTADITGFQIPGATSELDPRWVFPYDVSLPPTESISLYVLPPEWEVQRGKKLKSVLLVSVVASQSGILATTYLEAAEYGWGHSETEAIGDLVSSLAEYLESLESREADLGEAALRDLQKLRRLIL